MSQCVPSWDLEDNPSRTKLSTWRPPSNSLSFAPDIANLDYEVAELTWENGQLAMHGLVPARVPNKPSAAASNKYTWEKPQTGGTLESIVNQASLFPLRKTALDGGGGNELVPWFDHHRSAEAPLSDSASATIAMDALVPCANVRNKEPSSLHVLDSGIGTSTVDCSTRVGSCSRTAATFDNRRAGRAAGGRARDWSSRDQSVSGSATFERDSQQVSLDTCVRESGAGGFTSDSMGSPENTSSGKQCAKSTTADDHDSVCHSRPQREAANDEEDKKKVRGKSSVISKRSRAAAIHNQSERKRRDKINQRMKTLQKLVPNSSKIRKKNEHGIDYFRDVQISVYVYQYVRISARYRSLSIKSSVGACTDKASMLDEVIEYLKQLRAQVQMINRMNMSPMMLPMAVQQQLQLSMMAPLMGMGMGMGVMDMNSLGRSNMAGIPPVLHPSAFMPVASFDSPGDRLRTPASAVPDPLSAFLACQSQPMTMDAYSRMAALYQQMHQTPGPDSKN
ncbi:hypothetical protein RJ639_016634 [Escallonia herrerae]|uniref:BHLH domain-containing protein n=1 Tax=Escallonia herrerae TaxID=1293975 RepID=A0AA88VDJ1_9ASTE|nr:hypothetical protein RJ639_016634 [Escallonia herrerae]